MPAVLVDPTIPAQGAGIGPSPLAAMFGKAVNAYGQTFPNQLERADINYKNAETQKVQQQLGASQALGDIFSKALNPQPVVDPNAPPVEGQRPAPNFVGPEPAVQPTHTPAPDEILRANAPALVAAMQAGGHIEHTPQIARMMAAFLPGAADNIKNTPVGTPSSMDMAMLGSGESYESTPGGFREKNQSGYTAEQKNRTNKIQQIMQSQGVDQPTAEGLTDGLLELTTDQAGNRVLVNKATGATKLVYSMASGAGSDGRGGPVTPTQPQAAPIAPANGMPGDKPVNNPGNLRPVGATDGFMQYKTAQDGLQALQNDLNIKLSGRSQAMGGKAPTLRNIISTYSPPNENSTAALIQNAALRMGVNPDAPLGPQHLGALTAAIVQQEQGGTGNAAPVTTAAAPASPAQPAAASPTGFKMNPGDLGLPFETMYGGPAVAGRAAHTGSAVFGNNEQDPALAAFGKLTTLKNGLVSAMSTMPGRAANEGMQKRLLEQFPETDSNLIQPGNGIEQAGINPIDAETKFNQGIEEGVQLFQQASEALKNPYLDAKTRDSYQQVKSTIQKTLVNTLPPEKYAQFAQSVGIAAPTAAAPAPAAPSNLDAGKALTTATAYKAPADVVAAAKAGTLTRAQAKQILSSQFGIQ